MIAISKLLHKFEDEFDRHAEHFVFHYPCLATLALFVRLPIFILVAVSACTVLIALPIFLLFGWFS